MMSNKDVDSTFRSSFKENFTPLKTRILLRIVKKRCTKKHYYYLKTRKTERSVGNLTHTHTQARTLVRETVKKCRCKLDQQDKQRRSLTVQRH